MLYSQLILREIDVLALSLMLFFTEQLKGPLSYLVILLIMRLLPSLMNRTSAFVTSELPLYHEKINGVPVTVQLKVTLSLNSTRFVLLTVKDTFVIGSESKNKYKKKTFSVSNYHLQPMLNIDIICRAVKDD